MIRVRNYVESDYKGVKDVLLDAGMFDETWDSKEGLSGMITANRDAILVAVDNGIVVGNVYIIPFGSKIVHIYRLAVKKDYQNQGIASNLIANVEKIVKKRGVIEIGLFVDSDKMNLLDFYKKRDFGGSNEKLFHLWKPIK